MSQTLTHSSHWGGFTVRVRDGEIDAVHPLHDPDPSPLLAQPARQRAPRRRASRSRWRGAAGSSAGPGRRATAATTPSSRSPGTRRSIAPPASSQRVIAAHGNEAIFGGSYGWASAGLFHQSQSQLHRFLNLDRRLHLVAQQLQHRRLARAAAARGRQRRARCSARRRRGRDRASTPSCSSRSAASRIKNTFVAPGGMARHGIRQHLADARRRGHARSRSSARCATTWSPRPRRAGIRSCR